MRGQGDARASSRPGASTREDQLLERAAARLEVGELVEGRAGRRQEHDVARRARPRAARCDGRLEVPAALAADRLARCARRPRRSGTRRAPAAASRSGVKSWPLPCPPRMRCTRRGERGERDERGGDVRRLRVVDVEDAVDRARPPPAGARRRRTSARPGAAARRRARARPRRPPARWRGCAARAGAPPIRCPVVPRARRRGSPAASTRRARAGHRRGRAAPRRRRRGPAARRPASLAAR